MCIRDRYIRGVVSKQAHVAVSDGTFEEEVGRNGFFGKYAHLYRCLLYTSPSPRDRTRSRMPSSA